LDHQEPVLRSAGENGFLSGDFQGAEKHVFMIWFFLVKIWILMDLNGA
jgi:hypothetical protein